MSVKSVGLLAEIGNSCIFLAISGNFTSEFFSQPLFVSITLCHLTSKSKYKLDVQLSQEFSMTRTIHIRLDLINTNGNFIEVGL